MRLNPSDDPHYGAEVSTQAAGHLHAEALKRQQNLMATLGHDSLRYENWAKMQISYLDSEVAKKNASAGSQEKLKAEAWAIRHMLGAHGLDIRRNTQRKLEETLRDIL